MHAITRPASPATSNSSRRQEAKKKTAIGTMTKKFISSPLFKKIWTPSSSVSSAMSVSSSASSTVSHTAEEEEEEQREERAQEAFCDPSSKCGEIIADRWRLTALLGTGTYGAVYMAQTTAPFRRNEEQMAIKVLWKAGLDAEQLALQRLEVDINAALMAHAARLRLPRNVHPNIVPMRHFHEDAECLYLVMDLHQGTDLYEAIQDLGGLDTDLVKHVFRQIVAAVAHSHSAGVFHRDLKPENVLVTADWQCQLCDYGLSSMEEVTAELGCGSAPYMAPEARTPQNEEEGKQTYRCRQADIWSLGVLLLNLVFACNPWKVASSADPSFAAFLADPTVLQRQLGLSPAFFELLMGIFDLDPLKRPSLSAIGEAVEAMPSFIVQPQHGAESVHPDAIVLSSSPTDMPVMHQRPQEAANAAPEERLTEATPALSMTTTAMTPVASMHYVDAMMHRLQLQSAAHRAHHHHSSTSDTRRPVNGILAF